MKYALYPNTLRTAKKDSYLAKIITNGTTNLDDIIERMCNRSAGITKAEALGALTLFFEEVESSLTEGNTVNLPIVKIKPSIKGQFNNYDEKFNNGNHQLEFSVSSGEVLKRIPQTVRLEKTRPSVKLPSISSITDVKTGKEINHLKAGMLLEVRGNNFRFHSDNDEAGVFLESSQNTIPVQIIDKGNSQRLLILAPDEIPYDQARFKVITILQHHIQGQVCRSNYYSVE